MWRTNRRTNAKADYCKRVQHYLDKSAPGHGRELREHGIGRGWWQQIEYFHVQGKSVPEAARLIAEIKLNNCATVPCENSQAPREDRFDMGYEDQCRDMCGL